MSKITVNLDRERELKYNLNALIELDEMEDAEKLTPMRSLRRMLWAGLIHEDPDLTEEAVGEMVDMRNFPEIEAAMEKAIRRDAPGMLPEAKPATKPRPQKARKRA